MSLWLCKQEPVKQPYYIKELDVHIYSSQELSYVIVQNPLFTMEDFLTEELITFVQEQLGMGFVALKMAKLKSSGEKEENILALFLQEAEYSTPAEITQFKQKASSLRKMHTAEYRKMRADYLMEAGQYTKAIGIYETILAMPQDAQVNDSFIARIYYNHGTAHARLFQYEMAVRSYEKSYSLGKDEQVLKLLFYLQCMEPEVVISEQYNELMSSEKKIEWKSEFENIQTQIRECDTVTEIENLFDKDPVRRKEGLQQILNLWKKNYRRMQSHA